MSLTSSSTRRLITGLLILWILLAASTGSFLALNIFALPWNASPVRSFATVDIAYGLVAVCFFCLVSAVCTRLIRGQYTLVFTIAAGGIVLASAALRTQSMAAVLIVMSGLIIAWRVGMTVVDSVARGQSQAVLTPVAMATGLGLLASIAFVLGAFSRLTAPFVIVTFLAAAIAALAVDWRRGLLRPSRIRDWRPAEPTWFETVVIGITTGLVTFALLTSFVPEIQTDATREHLPIAREIWQSGTVAVFEPLLVSRDPVQGHLLYAVAFGFSGPTAATLVHTAVGLLSIWGIASIGLVISGRTAAIAGAAIFATMPIVLWEMGHAFLDLYPVLYTLTAATCILLWQREGNRRWLLLAGLLTGFGFAAKVTMAWSTVGLLAGLLLVGRQPRQWRERVAACLVFAVGNLVIVPWLLRGLILNGSFPGMSFAQGLLVWIAPDLANAIEQSTPSRPPFVFDSAAQETTQAYLASRGLGHTIPDLLRSPWAMTFNADQLQFPIIGRGEIGIALLMLLPLALLGPRTRSTALLAIGAIVAFLIWFSTPYQIVRHLLPTLGLLSALAGIGVAAAIVGATAAPSRLLSAVVRVGLVLALVVVPFLLLPSSRASLPTDYVLGRESAEDYVNRTVPSAQVLRASSDLLPPDTPVAYIGGVWEGPRLYTEARLVYVVPELLGESADEIIGNLATLDLRYLIWNRRDATDQNWRAAALSSPFLEEHARILAGNDDAYLLEILPGGAEPWGSQSPGDLLVDPEFASVRKGTGPWLASERATVKNGQVTLRRRATLSQEAEVQGGAPYVLTVYGACADPGDRLALGMQWFTSDGAEIANESERVLPGTEPNDQFIWRKAPDAATRVLVSVAATGSASCDVSRIALHQAH